MDAPPIVVVGAGAAGLMAAIHAAAPVSALSAPVGATVQAVIVRGGQRQELAIDVIQRPSSFCG